MDHGSTDDTVKIVQSYAEKYPWIELHPFAGKVARQRQGGAPALHYGLGIAGDISIHDLVVFLDTDVSFEVDFFERIIEQFNNDPTLGIAGGGAYSPTVHGLKLERVPGDHVRGACKFYRATVLKQVGGIIPRRGWDTIDELKAEMLGWKVRSFPEIRFIHHRRTGSTLGAIKGKAVHGEVAWYLGYKLPFMALRAIKNMFIPPYLLGGSAMLYGYLAARFRGDEQYHESEVIEHLRQKHSKRMRYRGR